VALSHCCCRTAVKCYCEVIVDCFIMSITQEEMTVRTEVPTGTRRLTQQLGLAAFDSSEPELQPPEKRDRRSLCGMSMEPAERIC